MGEWLSTIDPAFFWVAGAVVLVVVWLAFRASRNGQPDEPVPVPKNAPEIAHGGMSPELIAVITAAVTQARGAHAAPFRVAGIGQAQDFKTPLWGRIDRASYQMGTNAVR